MSLRQMTFGLPVGPSGHDRGADRGDFLREAIAEGRDETGSGPVACRLQGALPSCLGKL
jgi:hypothetical protein